MWGGNTEREMYLTLGWLLQFHLRLQVHLFIGKSEIAFFSPCTSSWYNKNLAFLHGCKISLPWRQTSLGKHNNIRVCYTSRWENVKIQGNVISPHRKSLEKYSADALRFWAAGSKLGKILTIWKMTLLLERNLETKLWNAASLYSWTWKTITMKTKKIEKNR